MPTPPGVMAPPATPADPVKPSPQPSQAPSSSGGAPSNTPAQQPTAPITYPTLPALSSEETSLLSRAGEAQPTPGEVAGVRTARAANIPERTLYQHQAATPASLVEASSEGWRIAGVAWYWWLALLVGVGGGTVLVRRRIQQRI